MALLRNDSKFLDGKKIASENFVLDNINTHNNEENPHGVTKSHIGLSNVSNVLQASKEEFDSHINSSLHVSLSDRENWNNKQGSITAGENITIFGNTISATNTTYDIADLLHDGLMSKEDKNKLVRSSNTLDYMQLEEGDYFNLNTLTSFMITESEQHIPLVNTSTQGLMSGSDKIKLDGIAAGAQINPSIATKAEAETGTNNAKMMTALRVKEAINVHYNDKSNPHNVTKVQIGLSNVVDELQATKDEFDTHTSNSTHITSLERNIWNAKQEEIIAGTNITKTGNTLSATDTKYNNATVSTSGLMSMADKEKLDGIDLEANNYVHPTNHPASIIAQDANNRFVTDTEKSTWNAKQNALGFTPENAANKGKPNGYASLDEGGKIPAAELPSYVDDVVEATALSNFPTTGETDKIYVTTIDNKTYRWSGTDYVEISASLALGNTSSTAYRGDLGQVAYTHSQTTRGNPHSVNKADVGLSAVINAEQATKAEFNTHVGDFSHITTVERNTWNNKQNTLTAGSNITINGNTISSINSTYEVATTSTNGLMAAADKSKLDGIEAGANNYTHPSTHPASIITQNSSNRFVTDAEKETWNSKQNALTAGLNMSISGSTISAVDTTYDVVTTSVDGLMSSVDKTKLNGIATGANNYTHPSSHPASIITETSTKRFVTDSEKSTWNAKADTLTATSTNDGLMASSDKTKLDGIQNGAQANPSIASQVEALTGTNNTNMMTPLRTKEVILESATIVVNHGTNSSMARPSGAAVVYWIGTVEPTNARNNDLWVGGL